MKRQARTTERDRLVIRADELTSMIVLAQERKCVTCSIPAALSFSRLTNGHLFGRTNHSTRWDVHASGNCHTQCWDCNGRHNEIKPVERSPYGLWFISKFGRDAFDDLEKRWRRTRKFSDVELREIVGRLEMHARSLGLRVGTHRIRPDMDSYASGSKRGKSRPKRNRDASSKRQLNRTSGRLANPLGFPVARCNSIRALTTRTKRPFQQRGKTMRTKTTKSTKKTTAATEKANREARAAKKSAAPKKSASKKSGVAPWKQNVLERESTKKVVAKINKATKAKPVRATALDPSYELRLAKIAASCGVIGSEVRDDVVVFFPN